MGDIILFRWYFAYSSWRVGGTNVVYAIEFGKHSLSGSLSMSSMVHVEGMFCLGRRGGEVGDDGSDMGFLLMRIREMKASEVVGFVSL